MKIKVINVDGDKKSDIEIQVNDGTLFIEGESPEVKEEFVHKGIATRSFRKQLQLSEYVECTGAKLENGMLKVELNYNPPEDKKAKKITVK